MSCRALIADDDDLCRQVVRSYLGAAANVELVAETDIDADTARQLLELRPELVFLDVQMPGLSGFEVLVRLEVVPRVIFSTPPLQPLCRQRLRNRGHLLNAQTLRPGPFLAGCGARPAATPLTQH